MTGKKRPLYWLRATYFKICNIFIRSVDDEERLTEELISITRFLLTYHSYCRLHMTWEKKPLFRLLKSYFLTCLLSTSVRALMEAYRTFSLRYQYERLS